MPEKPFHTPAPALPRELTRYRALSPLAGIHVFPIQLGAMSIRDKRHVHGMGAKDKEASFKLLNAYYDKGGNFIDTSCDYQDGSSEAFLGEWMETRGVRDRIILATRVGIDDDTAHIINYGGNHIKNLRLSVEGSLKKLRTSYIDILYVHWWDWATSVKEVMDSLHNLVVAGKVLYLGVSDTPAWVISKANQYANDHGKTPFAIYQGHWNVLDRTFEREFIPMARRVALAPFGVLGSERLRSDAPDVKRRTRKAEWKRDEKERAVSNVLKEIGKEVGTEHITAVAVAYVMHEAPYVFPIIGGRKVEHLLANLDALKISLTPEHIKRIESVGSFQPESSS
ncbi:aryl-alcohol dehydrogenase [Pterulicium gracile]|uniref:Aryl-alcohol dehydrogenase n=1 Tax=Pterulicium gracile TaxID=1884261 RepID=A0A5C3QXC8_9AGAR|nr:aryl-alcohol dehydrogenase [Pterula gracilis]